MPLLTIGGFTVDDIVTPDGAIHRGVAGGNALYTALGAHLAGGTAAMLTFVGTDHDPAVLDTLAAAGIDARFISILPIPSIVLWILYEPDGRRQIAYQQRSSLLDELRPIVERDLPTAVDELGPDVAVHLAALPVALQRAMLRQLRSLGCPTTVDSIEARGTVGGDLIDYREAGLLNGITAFLPSRAEFDVIRGDRTVGETVSSLMSAGPRVVVIKDGAQGCVVYDAHHLDGFRVAAYPASVVDPTGAGDVFCGAFAVTLNGTGDLVEAARRGVVAASFVVEAVGGTHLLDVAADQFEVRLKEIRVTDRSRAG